jgi:hypothetical protein
LRRQRLAVAVDDEAGQAVGLAVDEADAVAGDRQTRARFDRRAMRRSKNAASMRSLPSKLHARRRIDDSGLYAAPRQETPGAVLDPHGPRRSRPAAATLPSKIQG